MAGSAPGSSPWHVTGPTTGLPVTPSPTTGRSSANTSATFTGQPVTNASVPTLAGPLGSPVGLIANTLELTRSSCPDWASSDSDPVLNEPALKPPSSSAGYSSLVP